MSVRVKMMAMMVSVVAVGCAIRSCDSERKAVERVAEVEHAQWMAWSQQVAPEVSPERRARWRKYWVPYKDLPEEIKELDRVWARKAIEAARRR